MNGNNDLFTAREQYQYGLVGFNPTVNEANSYLEGLLMQMGADTVQKAKDTVNNIAAA